MNRQVDYKKEFEDWNCSKLTINYRLPSGNIWELGPLPLPIELMEVLWLNRSENLEFIKFENENIKFYKHKNDKTTIINSITDLLNKVKFN